MTRTRAQIATIALGLGVLAAVVPGLRLRGEPKVLHRGGGVTVERVDEALLARGGRVGAKDGDLLLDGGEISVAVGASTRGGRKQDFGAILDVASSSGADDALGSMRRVLLVEGKRVAIAADRVDALPGPKLPFLRIQERGGGFELTTDVVALPRRTTVELVTTLTNRSGRAASVRLGDAVDWSGVPTFAPGLGEVEEPARRLLTWFGRRGSLSYGLVTLGEPSEVEFRVKQSETAQTAWSPSASVEAGASLVHRRVLVATRLGLSEVARQAATLRGEPVGRATGVLDPAPAWALLTAIASDGTIALKEAARDDGTFDLALPPGRYVIVLQTPGGWDETPVLVEPLPAVTRVGLVVPQAERLDFRIVDPSGKLIPGRIVVTGVDGTSNPLFASIPKVSAAANEVHSISGEGRVDIPAGRYRVVVSRGIEWSLVERTIEVKPEQGVALRVTLNHTMPTPGWISADLHLHAAPSGDSELSLDDRVASLLSAGVEFAVATDHNHVTDYSPIIEAARAHPLLQSVSGVEITTRTWGHFNVYPLSPKASAPPFAAIDPPEIFAAARALSPEGVIQVNHPWQPGYGYFHRAALNERTGAVWRKRFSFDFDLIEVINGYEFVQSNVFDRNLERYWDLLNLGHRYAAVGSSDSHKLTNEWAGYPRTYVRVPDDRPDRVSVKDIVAALRAGHATVSIGPFIDAHVGDAGPGDTVSTTPGTLPLDITVRTSPWFTVTRVDIVVEGEVAESFDVQSGGPGDSVRFARVIELPVTRDSWVAVVARGDRPLDAVLPGLRIPPLAFTNPIWIDVGEPAPAPRVLRRAPKPAPVEVEPEVDETGEAVLLEVSERDGGAPQPGAAAAEDSGADTGTGP